MAEELKDSYLTIAEATETAKRERSSKFLAYAYPVTNEEQIRQHLEVLHKEYYDATHHCYAWRLGPHGEQFRANDDGEPSGTAGKPILGQLLSHDVTDCLIVVVRYFGGTKLGVSGLIQAYKEAAADVLAECTIIEKTVDTHLRIDFSYMAMNDVMRIIKDESPRIIEQQFDNLCTIRLAVRQSKEATLRGKLEKVLGLTMEIEENE